MTEIRWEAKSPGAALEYSRCSSSLERSQLKWLGYLVQMPPRGLHGEVYWACPTCPAGHAGNTTSFGWHGNASGSPQRSERKLPGRGKFPELTEEDGWMDSIKTISAILLWKKATRHWVSLGFKFHAGQSLSSLVINLTLPKCDFCFGQKRWLYTIKDTKQENIFAVCLCVCKQLQSHLLSHLCFHLTLWKTNCQLILECGVCVDGVCGDD